MRNAIVSYGSAATYPHRRKKTKACKSHAKEMKRGGRASTHDEVLIRLVRGFPPLFPSAHETPARDDAGLDLRQVYLHHHALLARLAVPHLGHAIPRAPDLQKHLALHARLLRRDLQLAVLHVPRGAARQVRLVLLALRVRQVGTFVRV